jgi:hypothetical protein
MTGRVSAGLGGFDFQLLADVLLADLLGDVFGAGIEGFGDLAVAVFVSFDLGRGVARDPDDDVEPQVRLHAGDLALRLGPLLVVISTSTWTWQRNFDSHTAASPGGAGACPGAACWD